MIELVRDSLLSPPFLAFATGLVAAATSARVGGRLRFPRWLSVACSTALLVGVGIKGGAALAETRPSELWLPVLVALALGCSTPVLTYAALRRIVGLPRDDAAAVAAHYGSVSVVTFTVGLSFVRLAGMPYEGFMPSLLALLEAPGIVVALLLAGSAGKGSWSRALAEIFAGRTFAALGSGLAAGIALSLGGLDVLPPAFHGGFLVLLTVFLLEMGLLAGAELRGARAVGPPLVGFAVVAPLVNGTLGILLGRMAGLSVAGTMLLGVLGASASYIAAPAAVRLALPHVQPARYLTPALGITFPFNLTVGMPVYLLLARLVH